MAGKLPKCEHREDCVNCPKRCVDCSETSDIYNHHPLYRKLDSRFEIEDLHIVLNPTPSSIRAPLNRGSLIGIKWMQGGAQHGTYHYFDEDSRVPTIEEVVKEVNVELDRFLRAAKSIAVEGE